MSNQTFSIWDGSVASSFEGGTGTEANPYLINSAAQLAYLEEVFSDPNVKKNPYIGKYYKLTSNIDLDKREWYPIGAPKKLPFPEYLYLAIHFDGDNHIVRGLYIDRPEESNQGLFGSVSETSSFKNITIEAAHVSGKENVGGLIGKFDSPSLPYDSIENCHFSGEIYGYYHGGGIVGAGGGVYLKDCTNAGTITVESTGGGIAGLYGCYEVMNCVNTGAIIGKKTMGGIVGLAGGPTGEATVFKYCQNSGDVINGTGISHAGSYEYCSNSGNISGAGGITHHCSGGYIKNCHNSGTITKEGDDIGGLTGTATNATIELCTNTGTVNGTGWRAGGICGQSQGSSTIEYCTNEGAVNSSYRVGGIVGEGNHVIQCYNSGAVKGVNYGAGICGYSETEDSLIAGCVNDGFIEATRYGAGIAGYFKGTVQNCINMAPIQTNSSAGGIVCKGGIAVKNCYNTGSIAGSSLLGGIIGSTLAEGFIFEKNYNSGEVGSASSSGGILGELYHNGGQIIDCHYHAGSAQKGIGYRSYSVSSDPTGYVDSVVSADDPKTVPAMLTQSIMTNTMAVMLLLFWGKKKQQLLTQISKLVSISKSLGVGQDEKPLNELEGDDMYIVTEHTPVRESADPNSNIIAMSFKKDIVKVLPQTRSAKGKYYGIITEEGLVGVLLSDILRALNTKGSGNGVRSMSHTGKRSLATAEALNSYCADVEKIIVFTDGTKTHLKEIKPKTISGESYLTVGFGIYTNDTKMNQWFTQKGIDITKPLSATYCKESFDYKISAQNGYEDAFNTWLDSNPNVVLMQQEYDALMIHRWQSGKLDRLAETDPDYLDTSVLTLLKNQNRTRSDWQTVFNNRRKGSAYVNDLKKRTEWELDVFFNGSYEGSNMWFDPLNTVYDNL